MQNKIKTPLIIVAGICLAWLATFLVGGANRSIDVLVEEGQRIAYEQSL